MVRLAERTASMRHPTLRLRARRSTPSAERTMRSMAGGVKVLWPESGPVEFAENKFPHGVGSEPFGDDRIGHAALDVVVDTQVEVGEQTRLADQHQVVVLGEVLEQQPQLAQVGQVHQMSIIEDGGHTLAGVVEAEGLFDEFAFAGEGGAFELDAEGVAEDFDGVGVGVQGSRDGGDEVLVVGEFLDGLFDDALAGAGHAEHEAESALLAVDLERVEDLLLAGQEFEFAAVEGVLGESEEGADHGCSFRRRSPLATGSRSRAGPMRWPLW